MESARPRIGVVLGGGDDALTAAVVARTVTLALLRRLPGARIEVLTTGTPHGASPLDCGRPVPLFAAGGLDRQRLDGLVIIGDAKVPARAGAGACPLVRLPGSTVEVAQLAARAAAGDLLANRVGLLRLLGWLPAAGTPHAVLGASSGDPQVILVALPADRTLPFPAEAGPDEIVAAVASAVAYAGSHPLVHSIAAGAGLPEAMTATDIAAALRGELPRAEPPDTLRAIEDALDSAAASAVDCWRGRGSPGAAPDPTASRRVSAENAALRVEIRRVEREVEAIELRANHAETSLRTVLGSRSWRYTEGARDLYRATRRRMGR